MKNYIVCCQNLWQSSIFCFGHSKTTLMMRYLPPDVLNLSPTLVNRHCAKFAKNTKKKDEKEPQDPLWGKAKRNCCRNQIGNLYFEPWVLTNIRLSLTRTTKISKYSNSRPCRLEYWPIPLPQQVSIVITCYIINIFCSVWKCDTLFTHPLLCDSVVPITSSDLKYC